MTLVVEDGTGLSTAEAYASVVEADAYFSALGNTAWTGSDSVKEIALRKATQYLEATYRGRWRGTKATGTQALSWPRYDVEIDGWCLAYDTLPKALKDATCELAVRALSSDLIEDESEPGSISSESVKVGPLEVSTAYTAGKSAQSDYPLVTGLLRGLVFASGTILRG